MFKKIKAIFDRYREFIIYVFFGGIVTVVNIVTYYLLHNIVGLENIPSNLVAWVVSVAVAFVTNKLWVFHSRSFAPKVIAPELAKFVAGRVATGALDNLIMFLAVDVAKMPDLLWKIIANIVTIILNYFVSKFLVFRGKSQKTIKTKEIKPSQKPRQSKKSS